MKGQTCECKGWLVDRISIEDRTGEGRKGGGKRGEGDEEGRR